MSAPTPRFGLVIAVVVVLLDQGLKTLMTHLLPYPGSEWTVTGFFNLVHVRNAGVSFGLMPGLGPWVLSGFALAVTAVLVAWLIRAESRPIAAALGLTIGGAVGNVIDRVLFGAVFDFLDFHAFGYHWPAFNLADSAITVGVAGLLIDALFVTRRTTESKRRTHSAAMDKGAET